MTRWRPIEGYEGLYDVSDDGQVRSLDRTVQTRTGPRRYRGKVLEPVVVTEPQGGRGEYLCVTLSRDNRQERRMIAHLVLEAWRGPRPPGQLACHRNGDSTDNHATNLRWGTEESNARDRVNHGRHFMAEREADKWGHRLAAPNLTATSGNGKGRECLACARALGGLAYAQRTGRPYDVRAEADRHYAEIMAGTDRGHNATLTHCPAAHRLAAPNLIPSALKLGRRACLTCDRVRGRRRKALAAGRPFDIEAIAAAIYAEIIGGAA